MSLGESYESMGKVERSQASDVITHFKHCCNLWCHGTMVSQSVFPCQNLRTVSLE